MIVESAAGCGEEDVAKLISIVVPCFNEEEVLCSTNRRLCAIIENLPYEFEIIYVDDGSQDSTWKVLCRLQAHDKRIHTLRFSRNFGHQLAITAGLQHASGNAVVIIDADLQDPPEIIRDFLDVWQRGFEVVYGVRTEREGETAFKLWSAKAFYRAIVRLSETAIPVDAGDFRLLDRRVVDALLAMPERDRFVRGMVSWLGFSQAAVPYRRAARSAGVTKFSFFRMARFAADGIFSFSVVPLRVATLVGFAASGIAVLGILVTVIERLAGMDGLVKGWASILVATLFVGGVQLICLGIMGEYVGRIYGESKRRPLFVLRESRGFESARLPLQVVRQVQSADMMSSDREWYPTH